MLQVSINKRIVLLGLWLVVLFHPLTEATGEGYVRVAFKKQELLKVKVHQLIVDPESKQPVVLLADPAEKRALFIWIDFPEARAIYSELQGTEPIRPLTHDLLEKVIQQIDGKIQRIVITHIKENIYYATLVLEVEGDAVEIDARPSDSIVMALKFNAPIFVSLNLFEEMAVALGEEKEIGKKYGLTLQELTPSLAEYLSFEAKHGVLVAGVRKGSRAEKDGLEVGDIFVELGGQSVKDVISAADMIVESKKAVKAKIFRKTRYLSITLHPN